MSPKNPFKKDNEFINYEYDSEAEWNEEDIEGESIACTDNEEDEEEEEEEPDSEDGWLVPDGYLSEGEGVDEPLPSNLNPDYDPG